MIQYPFFAHQRTTTASTTSPEMVKTLAQLGSHRQHQRDSTINVEKGKKHFHRAQKQMRCITTAPQSCGVQENMASEHAGQKRDNGAKTEKEQ